MSEETNETQTETPQENNVMDRKKAEVGYFDGELKTIPFNDGDSIRTLITKADFNFGDGQSINDDEGNEINDTDQAQDGKIYYICGNYKQG